MKHLFICLSFLFISYGCKKSNNSVVFQGDKEKISVKEETSSLRNESEIFVTKRKTEIEIDQYSNEILNLDKFIKDSKYRLIEVDLESSPVSIANVVCTDVTDLKKKKNLSSRVILNTKNLSFEIEINEGKFVEQKVMCEIFDHNNYLVSKEDFSFYQDLIVQENSSFKKNGLLEKNFANKVDTFILLQNVKLEILDQELSINAKKMITAKGSMIVSFDNVNAKENQHGLNGGKISITAEEAFGEVLFKLHGQNAGQVTIVPNAPNYYPSYYSPEQLKGAMPKTSRVDSGLECKSNSDSCKWKTVITERPTSGKPGLKGVPGVKGNKGLSGGNSGSASVYIKNETSFLMEVESTPGLGSKGGRGSDGGPGTPGGDVYCDGNDLIAKYCRENNIIRGQTGDRGDIGPFGDDGIDGMRIQSSFINQEASRNNRVF